MKETKTPKQPLTMSQDIVRQIILVTEKATVLEVMANHEDTPESMKSLTRETSKAFIRQRDFLEKVLEHVTEHNNPTELIIPQRRLLKHFSEWFNATDKTQSILYARIDEYLKFLSKNP